MMEFFLKRPLFAGVLSFVVLLAGLVTIPGLPISQYPQISPPTVTVTANFPGADAESVERSVTAPLERNINGTDGLQYMQSYSSDNGTSTITCTFALGTDPTTDQNNVQHGVDLTTSQLPSSVQQVGINVQKSSGNIVIAVALQSTDTNVSTTDISNYANQNIVEELKRIPGVGAVVVLGDRTYGMRIWLDPHKLQAYGLTIEAVVNAIQQQNADAAPGSIGQPPTTGKQPFQLPISLDGRLTSPQQFGQIVVAVNPNGGYVRLRDLARIELGAQSYATIARFNGKPAVALAVEQQPTANSLAISNSVVATMDRLAKTFPPGIQYQVAFDTSDFVKESIREVVKTLLIAIVLVVLVIFLFLQSWRSTLIPAITIPVSLIGTFALISALGFTINTLTLFGLTLATGLVVDDAIVVLENIVRHMQSDGLDAFEATKKAMNEITGAVVATSLVLMAVFIPVAFTPGTTGQLYKQFALTIAASIAISLFTALTLAPVLTLTMVRGEEESENRVLRWFNTKIEALRAWYETRVPRLIARRRTVVTAFAGCLALLVLLFAVTPSGFIPDEDQSLLYVVVSLPVSASMDQTSAAVQHLESIIGAMPEVESVTSGVGFGLATNGSNVATMFVRLKPIADRSGVEHTALALQYRLYTSFQKMPGITVLPVNPPAIPGLGTAGGFALQIEDRGNLGLDKLNAAGNSLLSTLQANPKLTQVRLPTILTGNYLVGSLDRAKALSFGVTTSNLFNALGGTIGSIQVNDFDYQDRSYHVYVQADAPYRTAPSDLSRIYVANAAGATMPVSQFITTKMQKSNVVISRFNEYDSFEIDGSPASGSSSGESIAIVEKAVQSKLPAGFSYDWSGIAREQVNAGPQTIAVFALGLLFTFLVLVAQYESLTTPLVIMLAVPGALLGAVGAIFVRYWFGFGMMIARSLIARHVIPLPLTSSDVYAQIGYVMLIGLAAKNAILIVEFANQLRRDGRGTIEAVTHAAATRLRPILMTSIAFILGILPLAFAQGDGAQARISLGTAVLGGMLLSTALNLVLVPVLYVIVVELTERKKGALSRSAPRR